MSFFLYIKMPPLYKYTGLMSCAELRATRFDCQKAKNTSRYWNHTLEINTYTFPIWVYIYVYLCMYIYIFIYEYGGRMRCVQLRSSCFDKQKATRATMQRYEETEI